MLFEDFVRMLVNLYLPFAYHSCPFKPKIKTADSCKQAPKC